MTGDEFLAEHLGSAYGIQVARTKALDQGVFRVDRHDGPSWVARVFPAERALEGVEGDAAILRALEARGFPSERCAHPEPVSSLDGQGVLVTEFVEAGPALRPGRPAGILGVLLGRLHSNPAAELRRGGAWHHLSFIGGPREEIAAATERLEDAVSRVGVRQLQLYHQLLDAVEATDDCEDLPHALVHPDFVPANAIPTPDEHLVVVDWTGAGRGPRLWSLAWLLWVAGARSPRLVEVVVSRYLRHARPEPEELDRLEPAMRARPLMLACWAFGAGRLELADAVARVFEADRIAQRVAVQARRLFEKGEA